jgi:hypothetical protein
MKIIIKGDSDLRVLEINNDTKKEIKKVITYAENNICDEAQIKLIASKDIPPVGDNPDHLVHIHDGYRVIYSIEKQPIGLCHHISISVESGDKYPNPEAVKMILKEFGMNEKLEESLHIWKEDFMNAINILQKAKK